MNLLQTIKNGFNTLLLKSVPKNYSMVEENNILGIHSQDFIITTKENLVGGLKLEGASYTDLTEDGISDQFFARVNALNAIEEGFEIRVVVKRRRVIFNKEYENIKNAYAKKVINLWEGKEVVFKNSYYIIFETKTAGVNSFLEKKKTEMTTSIKEEKNTNITFISKENKLHAVIGRFKQTLSSLEVTKMNSTELLRFYAEYINGVYIPINPKNGFLADGYIASNVSFHKDYFIQNFNGLEIFNRFIGVKAYDTDNLSSITLSSILHLEHECDVILSIDSLSKEKAKRYLTEKIKRASEIIKGELRVLKEEVASDRVSMQYIALNILIKKKSKEELKEATMEIINIFKNAGLVAVTETINMLPTFFSFFPNRSSLNARKRLQSSSAISSMILFEKEHTGRLRNSWGKSPLSVFKNQSKSPYLFNFHGQKVEKDGDMVLGHTMILGGSGSGKTTLMSFLIANCFKYDINILILDRLFGMKIMCEFLNGEYNDGEEFYINPFTLEENSENKEFLSAWLQYMVGIEEQNLNDSETLKAIQSAVEDIYATLYPQNMEFGLRDFSETILQAGGDRIEHVLERYLKLPLFQHLSDSLSFEKQITAINMDSLVNSEKNASLIALYLFHKMVYEAKVKNSGFFMFIDEAKSYTANEVMIEKINLILTQARKVNGVIALAFQDINQLDGVKNADSIIANLAHIMIYPTRNIQALQRYNIPLTETEKEFLTTTNMNERKILLKNMMDGTSNILDVDLSKLGKYINIFNSSASNVRILRDLKSKYPDWKERYLNT